MVSSIEHFRKRLKAGLIARQPGAYWWYRKALRGWAEPELALLPVFCLPGTTAVDVGANHGLFTYYLAPLCSELHAFEASPRMAALLRSGYRKFAHLQVHEVALSNRDGTATLQLPRFLGNSGYATLQDVDLGAKIDLSDGLDKVVVPTRRLDDYGLSNVSFVKIDVEGHEQEVLEGGADTLRRESAVVLVELEERHRKDSVRDVTALMEGYGYRTFILRDRHCLPFERSAPPPADVRNFIFCAATRLPGLARGLQERGFSLG